MGIGLALGVCVASGNPAAVGPDAGERAVAIAVAEWQGQDGRRIEVEFQAAVDTRGTGMLDDAHLAVGVRSCRRSACGETTWFDASMRREQFAVHEGMARARLEAESFGQAVVVDWLHPEGGDTTGDSRVQAFSPVLPHGQVRVFVRESRFAEATVTVAGAECQASRAVIESYVIYDGVVAEAPTGIPDHAPTEPAALFGSVPCHHA